MLLNGPDIIRKLCLLWLTSLDHKWVCYLIRGALSDLLYGTKDSLWEDFKGCTAELACGGQ